MFDKKFLKFLALQVRMYEKVLGDSAITSFYVEELNNDIMDLMKSLINLKEEE